MLKHNKQFCEMVQNELVEVDGGNRIIPIIPIPIVPLLIAQEIAKKIVLN